MLADVIRKPVFPIVVIGIVAAVALTMIGIQAVAMNRDHEEDLTVSAEDYLGTWVDPEGTDEEHRQEITLIADNMAGGSDGCNRISSKWLFDESRESIVFEGFFGTEMACMGADGEVAPSWVRQASEASFVDTSDKDTLTIYDVAGNRLGDLTRE